MRNSREWPWRQVQRAVSWALREEHVSGREEWSSGFKCLRKVKQIQFKSVLWIYDPGSHLGTYSKVETHLKEAPK